MSVSNEFKNITKKIKQQNIKLSICDGELAVKEIHMMPVHIFNALPVWKLRKQKETIAKELKYSFDGQLFKTIMKQVEITVKNANEIKDKDINFQYGLFINNKFEYIDLGNYFIKDIEDSKKKDEITVTGYDRMIRFMKIFKQSELQLTYPCKMLKLVQKMCEVCGVELYSTDFYNADLDVEEDFFTAQELTYRDVLEKIAQATLTTAFIEDNKLNLYKVSNDAIEKIDKSYLTDLTIKEKFGPANALVLGRGDVEDNIEETDEKSIEQNGRCEIRFDENEFIEFQREKVIKGMFEQIKGLEYYSFEASDVGVMWLKPCACIELGDKEDSLYKSYYLKANITINTGISSDIEAEIPETTDTEYKVTTKEEKKTLKVERLAKKNEGKIQDLVEETSENSEKLTKHEQTIDSMKDTLKSQETKIETVDSKANKAQSTADAATTKANNAQTSANNAQSTANTANINAQNAQKTADANTTKITTNTTKIAEVEKTVDGITQSVSAVEEKIETVESTADSAKTTANTANSTAETAKSTADSTNKNLTTNYYTKTETNSQITQKAESITSAVSKTYSTKTETSTAKSEAINSANTATDNKLKGYTETSKLGTAIEQNYEHVKVAWNQISDFIQMMIINKNASLAILDKNKNVMMALDKEGQHFYKDDGTEFGEMGVNTIDNQNYISFGVTGNYGQEISDGMAWGITTKKDNKFWPILYIKNFVMSEENSDGSYGELVLSNCNLVLDGVGTGMKSGGVFLNGDPTGFGLYFWDEKTNKSLLAIHPENVIDYASITILDNIKFYANQAGSNSFKLGTGDNYCLFTDDGAISGNNLYINGSGTFTEYLDCHKNINCDGNVYAKNISSDKRLKKNIKNANDNAIKQINKIKIKSFDWKEDNVHTNYGFIAQELEKIDKNYVLKQKVKDKNIDYKYYVNELPILATATKAIQEQQEQIEQLQLKDKQKDELIQSLIQRIETLEKEVNK